MKKSGASPLWAKFQTDPLPMAELHRYRVRFRRNQGAGGLRLIPEEFRMSDRFAFAEAAAATKRRVI
jgi:hypothetical protein